MQIVLPGALPDAAIAHELIAHIEEKAPHFAGWLAHAQADVITASPADTLCTPYEYWLLRRQGFVPEGGQRASAGLPALLARETGVESPADQPLWLAQLVHMAPARDGAALIPASELDITGSESAALFEAAAEYFPDTGFGVAPFDTAHWRIELPAGYLPACASPALVSITAVNEWWKQDTEGRPWRRLVNELQMLWFDHPVNRAREERGLRPINSVWLYGGAQPSQLAAQPSQSEPPKVFRNLQGPGLVQDWGSWLYELQALDQTEFSRFESMPDFVLTGADRIVELSRDRRGFIAKLVNKKPTWRQWWSGRN